MSVPGSNVKFLIAREAYRGPPGDECDQVPDVIVLKSERQVVQRGQPFTSIDRDILWIECKAPLLAKPHGFNMVMEEIVIRLSFAHKSRMVYFIPAADLRWMIFRWDPTIPPVSPLLEIKKTMKRGTWLVDPRVHPIPGEQYVLPPQSNGKIIIDTTLAHSLDFWTINPATDRPAHEHSMQALERHFQTIRTSQYVGQNPLSFR
ncbi:hypothetical protein F5Y16DRAFT_405554 [Xylariaceae sp. FL0255]|nr:hypothetical protein F5Y16DRAFT_405554 [Xylariaceae sp. FL0255]